MTTPMRLLLKLSLPLNFLGAGRVRKGAKAPPSQVSGSESMRNVSSHDTLENTFAPAGGYPATVSPAE